MPVSDKTVFAIHSITKAFTGVAIVQLVEAGTGKAYRIKYIYST
ncbi:serine hydrolase [Chitinophaga eiseniae]